jgi:peptidoglycan/xylan/chitin deacetylase (PgdA/CDA1 family)
MGIYEGTDAVSLVFDDGPNPKITPQILEVLKAKGVKATFFLIGKRAEEYPDVVKQIINEGHDIGNHSYTHKGLAKLLKDKGKEAVLYEIQQGAEVLKRLANISDKELQFFRPPYLDWDDEVGKIAAPYYSDKIIMAKMEGGDYNWGSNHTWDENDVKGISKQARLIVADWESNDDAAPIIALHDSAEFDLPGNPSYPDWMNRALPTLQALPTIIDNVHRKGAVIKKLSEMGLKTEPLRVQ